MLLPKRWIVARDCVWTTRFRRLAREDERGAATVVGLHLAAFAMLFVRRAVALLMPSP